LQTRVVIIGGGPAGLIAAIELGRRNVPCVLLEEDAHPARLPKANATTARTMEHFRRLGCAAEIRALGLPLDYPQDVAYFTRFTGPEMARLRGLTRGQAVAHRAAHDDRWPTPEPLHRAQQMFIEPVLVEQLGRYPSIDFRAGMRAVQVAAGVQHATVEAVDSASGARIEIAADYVVGCEGPRSLVREAIGTNYAGMREEDRDFMGGRMLSIFFRSQEFYSTVPHGHAWQYWALNPERRGVVVAIDGKDLFGTAVQLARGQTPTVEFASACLTQTMGREYAHEIIAISEWTAGFTLVAERFAEDCAQPRLFLAGDAAHLFTPTGGQGYNTAVDDAVNLGWKLAAACNGWAGANLLASYEAERSKIAHRNTRFARAMADSIGRLPLVPHIEAATLEGEAARAELGRRLDEHAHKEFDIPGIHLGVFYAESPIVAGDTSTAPPDDWHVYRPHATPGARAPHIWIGDGVSIFDRFGVDFTLVRLGKGIGQSALAIESAARTLNMPLAVLDVAGDAARKLYGADFVLVRPDHHIAWRADSPPSDALHLLRTVTGH